MSLTLFSGSLQIQDWEQKVLENDLLDIETWVSKSLQGKINNCKKRMITQWQPIIFNDPTVTSIPATDVEFINYVTSRDDYKNKKELDTE